MKYSTKPIDDNVNRRCTIFIESGELNEDGSRDVIFQTTKDVYFIDRVELISEISKEVIQVNGVIYIAGDIGIGYRCNIIGYVVFEDTNEKMKIVSSKRQSINGKIHHTKLVLL
jgi:hypothetical protein